MQSESSDRDGRTTALIARPPWACRAHAPKENKSNYVTTELTSSLRTALPVRTQAVRAGRPTFALPLPLVLVLMAFGTLAITNSYALSRFGHSAIATAVFWVGQLVVFVPPILNIIAPETRPAERLALVLSYACIQVFTKWMYSPLVFSFGDELLHLRTAHSILATHHLFHSNPTMPISPRYPGFEELAAAVVSVTHLPLFAAGFLVVGVAHVLVSAFVYFLVRLVTGSDRVAGVGAMLLALTPNHAFLDSAFIYESLALPLGVLAIYLSVFPGRSPRAQMLAVTALVLGATVVTHHLTAMVATAALLASGCAFGFGARRAREPAENNPGGLSASTATKADLRELSLRALTAGSIGLAMLVAWIAGVAPVTLSYLGVKSWHELSAAFGGGAGGGIASSLQPPLIEDLTIAASVAVFGALVVAGAFLAQRGRSSPTATVFATFGLLYLPVVGLRLVDSSAAEVTARSLIYVGLFASLAAALSLENAFLFRPKRSTFAAGAVVLSLIFAGSIVIGWPPWWERLPGTFHVAAWESGIDRANTDAARWGGVHLGTDQVAACDIGLCSLLGAYGHTAFAENPAAVFYAHSFDGFVRSSIASQDIRYVFVDRRLIDGRPPTGRFFAGNPVKQSGQPLTPSALEKFEHSGLDRLYDDGNVDVYQTGKVRG